ncbi:MAG: hypothetical protein PHC51_13650 [bacterium]|nr:hypothetical protein [bacterium]
MESHNNLDADGLKNAVCRILQELGLKYQTEQYSHLQSSIIGKRRRVDVVVTDNLGETLMFIECKAQNTSGTTEDKLFRAVSEANRDKLLGTPSIIVFSGCGWSTADMRHAMLNGAVRIEILRDWLTMYFMYEKASAKKSGLR